MTVQSVGQAMATRAQPETARNEALSGVLRLVIDAQTIKTILYLGLKGDIALGGAGGDTASGASRTLDRGVDMYA